MSKYQVLCPQYLILCGTNKFRHEFDLGGHWKQSKSGRCVYCGPELKFLAKKSFELTHYFLADEQRRVFVCDRIAECGANFVVVSTKMWPGSPFSIVGLTLQLATLPYK